MIQSLEICEYIESALFCIYTVRKMLDSDAEWFYNRQLEKFQPNKEEALKRIDQFVDSIHYSSIGNMPVDKEILAACSEVAPTVNRKTISQGEHKFTFHGLGNNVALLQVYNTSGKVSALWYIDFTTTRAMELVAGLSQFGIKVIAREGTYTETGNNEFSHDTFHRQVYIPAEEIDESYFEKGDNIDYATVMSCAPSHEIGHALSELGENFNKSSQMYDMSRELQHKFNRKKLHKGSSLERISMIASNKVVQAGKKHGINLWRNYYPIEVFSRINQMIHW